MKKNILRFRNNFIRFFYKNLLKKIYFKFDPEVVHDRMILIGKFLSKFWITRKFTSLLFNFSDKSLEQNILGIHFKNPVGLSAGFDKNAELTNIIPDVGFGFEEIGSITGEKCEGNSKPRLWRLKKSESLLVYYGLKNDGSEIISSRLKNKSFRIPVGISVAKTNSPETVDVDAGVKDYVKAFVNMKDIGDYVTINISCPNAFGGEPFTDVIKLEKLLTEVDKIEYNKPIFIKLSPDLTNSEIDGIINVSEKHKISGFVCTNLTKNRNNSKILDKDLPDKGGISGKIVQGLSDDLIKYIYKKTNGKYIIIGVGGISSAHDAYNKIKSGANLLQLITGMIFEGPELISDINIGIAELLKKDGYKNISEAVGTGI